MSPAEKPGKLPVITLDNLERLTEGGYAPETVASIQHFLSLLQMTGSSKAAERFLSVLNESINNEDQSWADRTRLFITSVAKRGIGAMTDLWKDESVLLDILHNFGTGYVLCHIADIGKDHESLTPDDIRNYDIEDWRRDVGGNAWGFDPETGFDEDGEMSIGDVLEEYPSLELALMELRDALCADHIKEGPEQTRVRVAAALEK